MEIVEKSNFRFKALVIALVTVILASTCTMSFGFSLFNKAEDEPYYNRKVEFTGDTHYYSDGSAKRLSLFKKGQTVRKTYTEEKPGCGIVTIISKNAKYPYYVSGEGWIGIEQIKQSERFIQIEINLNDGLNTKLHINGEYINVESDNTGVVRYEDGALVAGFDGTTTINLIKKDGETVELVAVVANGNLELNIPEKELSAEITADASFIDQKIEVKTEGNADVALIIDDGIKIAAEGDAKAELYVDDKKVAECDAEGNMELDITSEGLDVTGNANQSLTILDRLTIKLREAAKLEVDKQHANIEGEGAAEVNDNEVFEGKADMNYNYGDEDPTGSLNATVLDNNVVNVEDKTIPVISGLKALIARVRK